MIELIVCITSGMMGAFMGLFFYRRGLKDGINITSGVPLEKIVEKPEFLKTTTEKAQAELEQAAAETQKALQEDIQKLWDYQPQHTAKRVEE